MIPSALHSAQFAEYIETIEMLYVVDEDFKTLCDDYGTSKMNLEKFKEKPIADKRTELDYQQLSYELEKEILDYIRNIS